MKKKKERKEKKRGEKEMEDTYTRMDERTVFWVIGFPFFKAGNEREGANEVEGGFLNGRGLVRRNAKSLLRWKATGR